MKAIEKKITVPVATARTYELFIKDFGQWWPKAYTWSQDTLVSISIDPSPGGLCTEIGPSGFRCDWGRLEKSEPGKFIWIKWQIGPSREPVPDASKSSDVLVTFQTASPGTTNLLLEHRGFEKHGPEGQAYRDNMDSPKGWEYLLDCFKSYSDGL